MRRRSSRSACTRVSPSEGPCARFGPILRLTRTPPAHHEPYQLSFGPVGDDEQPSASVRTLHLIGDSMAGPAADCSPRSGDGYDRSSASQASSMGRVKRMWRPTRRQGRCPARTASYIQLGRTDSSLAASSGRRSGAFNSTSLTSGTFEAPDDYGRSWSVGMSQRGLSNDAIGQAIVRRPSSGCTRLHGHRMAASSTWDRGPYERVGREEDPPVARRAPDSPRTSATTTVALGRSAAVS